MNRSALPFLAASIADRSPSAPLRLRRDKSSRRLVIYRKAVYQTEAPVERLAGPLSRSALPQGKRVRQRTPRFRRRTPSSLAPRFQAGIAGTRFALFRPNERPALRVARALEESDHDTWRHARAGSWHRRDDDDVRIVEGGDVKSAAVSGIGSPRRALGQRRTTGRRAPRHIDSRLPGLEGEEQVVRPLFRLEQWRLHHVWRRRAGTHRGRDRGGRIFFRARRRADSRSRP